MVIIFDGVCNLCNGFVRFVLKRDKNKTFQFASLQSKYGRGVLEHFELSAGESETIILLDRGKIFTESDAVIKILSSLGGIWKYVPILSLIPRSIRNWFYRIVARNRYKIFGKKDQCTVTQENTQERFLENETFLP